MQTISLIAAMGKNREIGDHGKIPWRIPKDFAHFKELTEQHAIIMGRKTFESIGIALPNRRNIIITRQKDFHAAGCTVVDSLDAALSLAGNGEVFVIGGAEVYREALSKASRMYLTFIDADFSADTYFPEFDVDEWREVKVTSGIQDEKNPYHYTFVTFEKKF